MHSTRRSAKSLYPRCVPGASGRSVGAVLSFVLALAVAPVVHAQSSQGQSGQNTPEARPKKPQDQSPKKAEPGPPAATPKGNKDAGAASPTGPLAGKRKPAEKVPQTADEKAKLLSDLYAQLAAAEDEAAAKRISDAIERVWLHSGSDTVDLLMERALRAINGKNPELAKKLLDSVVSLAPDYPEGFNRRAYFAFTQNNYESAVGDLRRVLALDPNHYKALEGLSQIWRETGNKKGALRIMKQLLDVNPYAAGAQQAYDELKREVDGQGI